MEDIVLYELASIPCIGAYYYIILLIAAWVSYPGGRYWVPGSSKSSCQASLDSGMLENFYDHTIFETLQLSYVASSELSSSRFYQFPGTVPFLMGSAAENVLSQATWYWGEIYPVLVFNIRSTDLEWNGKCTI